MLIGLTTSGPRQAETIERALEVGGFDAVQSTWNLLERSAGPALAAAHAAGCGVIIKEALANGRLTDRGAVPELAAAARDAGTTPGRGGAGRGALAQPWVDVVLSGAATVDAARGAISGRSRSRGSTPDAFDGLVEDPETYWEERGALPWN